MDDNGPLHFREGSDKVAACVGILSHLQRYLEPFGSGSEGVSLKQLHLLSALGCSAEANVLVAFSLQDLRANFMGPGVIGACLHCRNLYQTAFYRNFYRA